MHCSDFSRNLLIVFLSSLPSRFLSHIYHVVSYRPSPRMCNKQDPLSICTLSLIGLIMVPRLIVKLSECTFSVPVVIYLHLDLCLSSGSVCLSFIWLCVCLTDLKPDSRLHPNLASRWYNLTSSARCTAEASTRSPTVDGSSVGRHASHRASTRVRQRDAILRRSSSAVGSALWNHAVMRDASGEASASQGAASGTQSSWPRATSTLWRLTSSTSKAS